MPTILIVDDEPTILRLASLALARRYKVLTAASGEAGLAMMADEPVDLVLTDHRMPNMSGVELMREVRHRHPGLPVILSTGYTDESELRSALSEHDVRVLYKPWTPTDLREAVDGALGN